MAEMPFMALERGFFETGSDAVGVRVSGFSQELCHPGRRGTRPPAWPQAGKKKIKPSHFKWLSFFPVCVRVRCGPSRSNKRAAVRQDAALNDLNAL